MVKTLTPKRGEKSAVIREYLNRYPDLSVPQIVERILDEKGIEVSDGAVYNIRAKLTESNGSGDAAMVTSAADLQKAKAFITEMGGLAKAVTALGDFAALVNGVLQWGRSLSTAERPPL